MGTASVGVFHAAPAPADKARFVFTPLAPPASIGEVYVTGVYQDRVVGWYESSNDREGVVWGAGTYTNFPGVDVFHALSDSGVAVGRTPGSNSFHVRYSSATAATQNVGFGVTGGEDFTIGGANASGAIAASPLADARPIQRPPRRSQAPFRV